MDSLSLRCGCGALQGTVDVAPRSGLHVVCYCDDCRAYAHALDRSDLLDKNGGTEIFQTAPSRLKFTSGFEQARCLRLSGMFRWYAGCCNTPIANVMARPGLPILGLASALIEIDDTSVLGPITRVQARFATGSPPADAERTASLATIARVLRFVVAGRLRGAHKPHPFFIDGRPAASPRVLSGTERDALREAT
jgi:hypothetical protein